jgi:alkylated DNA repair dioxygenase AlkB
MNTIMNNKRKREENEGEEPELPLNMETFKNLMPSIVYLTPDKKSWIVHVHQFMPSTEASFNEIWNLHPKEQGTIKMFGKEIKVPRYNKAYGKTYDFAGVSLKGDDPATVPVVEKLLRICNNIEKELEVNGCLINWYEPEHYIGAHSDDEKSIIPGSSIFSLSWGASRIFRLEPKKKKGEEEEEKKKKKVKTDFVLNDGDLLIMGGTCQVTHKHSLPKSAKCSQRRINFTLRSFF